VTAWDLIERYTDSGFALPEPGMEYDEIDAYARALHVDTPEPDSIVAVVQMLRQRQQEALREAGQMTLI
jgi:hypothetical protein